VKFFSCCPLRRFTRPSGGCAKLSGGNPAITNEWARQKKKRKQQVASRLSGNLIFSKPFLNRGKVLLFLMTCFII